MSGKVTACDRCCDCAHEWTDLPIGFARQAACPACGSAYWVWLNYGETGEGERAMTFGDGTDKRR